MKSYKINRFQGSSKNIKNRIRSLVDKLKKLELNIGDELGKIIMGHESRIVEMIQIQMWNGKNGKEMGGKYGDIIRPLYRPSTIKRKIRKGQPYDRVTLKDTGMFYRKMRVSYNKRYGFFIKSTDSKYPKLIEKYGTEIFRLDRENFNDIIKIVRRELQKVIKKELLNRS